MKKPARMRTHAAIDIANASQVAAYRVILSEMISILRDCGFQESARVVEAIMSYLEKDGALFAQQVAGSGIWGSLGFDGVAGCSITATAPLGSITAYRLQHRLYELLVDLADQLKADGMSNSKVESLAGQYADIVGPKAKSCAARC